MCARQWRRKTFYKSLTPACLWTCQRLHWRWCEASPQNLTDPRHKTIRLRSILVFKKLLTTIFMWGLPLEQSITLSKFSYVKELLPWPSRLCDFSQICNRGMLLGPIKMCGMWVMSSCCKVILSACHFTKPNKMWFQMTGEDFRWVKDSNFIH